MNARGLLFIAAMIVASGMLALAWYLRQPAQLVRQYQVELAAAPDDQVEPPLRRFAELGDAGLRALTAALASHRPAVRQMAQRVLLDVVDRWELLPEDAVAPRLAALAQVLAEAAPRMDLENRRFAADLAMRLLLWPRAEENRTCPWLAECEAVLAAAVEHQHRNATAEPVAAHGSGAASESQPASATAGLTDLNLSLADKMRLPGGDLPLELSAMPDEGGFVEPHIVHRAQQSDPREPRRLQFPSDARSLDGDDDDDGDATGSQRPGGANHPGRLPSSGGSRSTALGLQASRQSLDGMKAGDAAAWQRLEPRDVMRRLHGSDPQIVLAARVELERRGITGPLMDLARRATDPDPNVRRQLAESLPSLPGVDAKPWLMQLSYDDNPQVRATAVTLMATSGDLEMARRLEQISRDDPDDYIRSQATKAVHPGARAAGQ